MKYLHLIVVMLLVCNCSCHRFTGVDNARYTYDSKKPLMMMMPGPRRVQAAIPQGIHFRNIARIAGLNYESKISGNRPVNILQGIGTGCAFFDYDGDSNLDILLIGENLTLFRGDGHGKFTNVTETVGLNKFKGNYRGCAIGDIDGDGYDDIYISGYQTALMLHNDGGKGFHDITLESGLSAEPWGSSCAFGETEPGSGKLDLYVCNYVDFTNQTDPQECIEHNLKTSCGPVAYKPLIGKFFSNDGKGHFTEVTSRIGLNTASGKGLGIEFVPLEKGKSPVLAISNDEMPSDLFVASKSGTNTIYNNTAQKVGVAFDRDGHPHGGMGLDFGDFNNDGLFDIFVTTFEGEARSLYRNSSSGVFIDVGSASGFGLETSHSVAFGCRFFDFDNDGWLDMIISNGHVQDNIAEIRPHETYRQLTQIFHNSGGVHPGFDDISSSIPEIGTPIVGRGLATGDFDNDGRIDALVMDAEGKPQLLHNECVSTGHWLGIKLIGSKSNRDGYGAVLTLTAGNKKYVQYCHADGSYESSSDPRVHFGLGKAKRIDKLEIVWPSGIVENRLNIDVDRYITIQEKKH